METLFGGAAPAVAPAPPAPVSLADRKNPSLAFALSLLLPGAGLIYCGKKSAGVTTMLFFAGAIAGAVFIPPQNMFWGVMLRMIIVLYAYAFLDSFYTAREHNAGMAPYIIGNNPRIAATLNLLTNGFGYFYLGERKKGLICFFALRIFSASAKRTPGDPGKVMGVIAEVVFALLAIDAYRLARKQMREAFPATDLDPFVDAGGLSAVPVALAAFFVFNYVALVTLGLSMPSFKTIDQGAATVKTTEQGTTYANSKYGVALAIPPEWVVDTKKPQEFLSAKKFAGGCNVQVLADPRLPVTSAHSFSESLRKQLAIRAPNARWLSEKPVSIGGLSGREVSFMSNYSGVDVRQNYLSVPKGLAMYAVIETMANSLTDECSADFTSIRNSIRFQ